MKTIGQKLRTAREHQHLTIDDVNARIRIPPKYVVALETGDTTVFPAEVYVTGSLRRYAQFLGLNVQEILGAYHDVQQQARAAVEAQKSSHKQQRSSQPNVYVAIAAVVVLALIAGVFIAMLSTIKPGASVQPSVVTPVVSTETVVVPAVPAVKHVPVVIAVATATITRPVTAAPVHVSTRTAMPVVTAAVRPVVVSTAPVHPVIRPGKELVFSVQCRKDTWMRVKTDDTVVYDAILSTGAHQQWGAQSTIAVQFGYLTAVTGSLNGYPLDIRTMATPHGNVLILTRETLATLQRQGQQ
jgi:cytoskeleton protein RodZ